MSKSLVWIDSVVMGVVLVMAGFAVCLVAVGVQFPYYFGILLLGILFAAIGIALVMQGLRRRPHEPL